MCKHPPERNFAWLAYDGTLCIGCTECGQVLRGAAPPVTEERKPPMNRTQARTLAEEALNELTLYDDYAFVHDTVLTGCNGGGYWVSDRFAKVEHLSKPEAVETIIDMLVNPPPELHAYVVGGEWVEE